MNAIFNGAAVQYRHGSEPWAFSKNPAAIRTVESIRCITDARGMVTHAYAKLAGRFGEVGLCDLMAPKAAQ